MLPSCASSTSPSSSALLAAREPPHQPLQSRNWVSNLFLCLQAEAVYIEEQPRASLVLSCPDMHCTHCHPLQGRVVGHCHEHRSLLAVVTFIKLCTPAGPVPSEDGTPPPPPPLPVDLLQTADVAALWNSAAAGPSPAHVLTNGATQPGTPQHGAASLGAASADPSLDGDSLGSHQKDAAAPSWQRQPVHDSSSMAPYSYGGGSWVQQQAYHGQQGQRFGHQESQTGQNTSSWQGTGTLNPEEKHAAQQGNSYGVSQAQANGWHGLSEAQALGAGSMGYPGQLGSAAPPGSLGSMLQGIMTSVRSKAGFSPAHLSSAPSPAQGDWPPPGIPKSPAGGQMFANGQLPGAAVPGEYVNHQQAPQPGAGGHPWYG